VTTNNHGVTTRTAARTHSQGPPHASAIGKAHANRNSVLAGTGTATTAGTTRNSHGITTRIAARAHSRGALHASARAKARANANGAISISTTTTTTSRGGR
jgi:hypothetical protein